MENQSNSKESVQLSTEEVSELKNEITALKELYEKELEREAAERDKQISIDSSEAEISAKKIEEQTTKESKERQELGQFRDSVLSGFFELKKQLEINNQTDLNTSEIEDLNKNINALIQIEEFNTQKSANLEFLGVAIFGTLVLFVAGFILYKIGGLFGKLIRLI